MQTRSKTSCCIDRRAVEKGSRPPVANQAGIEKSVTSVGTSQPQSMEDHQNRSLTNLGTPDSTSQTMPQKEKKKRQKWTREDYKQIMFSFYKALDQPIKSSTQQTYEIWRSIVGNSTRDYIDANKLANVRRDIMRNNKLTDSEIREIKERIATEKQLNEDLEIHSNETVDTSESGTNMKDPYSANVNVIKLTEEEISAQIDNIKAGKTIDRETTQLGARNETADERADIEFKLSHKEDINVAKEEILVEIGKADYTDMSERQPLPKIKTTKATRNVIKIYNFAMNMLLAEKPPDLTELNQIMYATAAAATEKIGIKIKRKTHNNRHKEPAWKRKIQAEITALRGELSLLDELYKGNDVKGRRVRKLVRKFKLKDKGCISEAKEILKQKIQVKAQRVRRFEKRTKFYRQNKIFQTDAKRFYREIGKKQIEIKEVPTMQEVEKFWESIWSNPKTHNEDADWIGRETERMKDIEPQKWTDITKSDLQSALKKAHKWKSPGIDKVPNFWLSELSSSHDALCKLLSNAINDPLQSPKWLTEGITFLLPKNEDTKTPKNYRPITCLSTTYKILTSILTDRTYQFLETNNTLPLEQKGCKRGSYGCKDQLLINKMILENCKSKKRNLSTAWIDYKKAFDSVPHSWILKALEIYKVSPVVVNFLKNNIKQWQTTLMINNNNEISKSKNIKINRGIFQGDSLSPLLFCLCLIPLTHELNRTTYGYRISEKTINHLFYMDDLKLYAKNDSELEGLLKTVKQFSDDIGMEFGLDKCAKASFTKGRLTSTEAIEIDSETQIRDLDQEEVYKYLGVNEGDGIQHAQMKEKVRKEYYRRVRLVLRTELNSQNRIIAINSLAVPVVQYSYNILNWKMSEIRRMDIKTRKFLTMHKMHHPKADKDRIYLPRQEGGRGLIQLEMAYKSTTISLSKYLASTEDWMMQLVDFHESKKKKNSVTKQAKQYMKEWKIKESQNEDEIPLNATSAAKSIKKVAKKEGLNQLQTKWQDKHLHSQYPTRASQADVDKTLTHQWLRSAGLKAETEGFILAAQDQCLFTRNYQANILKNGADPKCRFCDTAVETIDHIISGCSVLAPNEYKNRHDRLGQYIHWQICKHYGRKVPDKWYEHHPEAVTEIGDTTILWDFTINTDRTIKANRPDITVRTKKETILIDMAVPSDKNIASKVFEKKSKYTDLVIEINKMWHTTTKIVPVVIGALGMIRKGTNDYISQIPGNVELSELQKITLNSTAHTLRRALSM